MADSIKRIQWSRDAENQDRILYFLFQKAKAIRVAGTSDQKENDLCDRIYTNTVNKFAACMLCATNATIGEAIDGDNSVSDSNIEYVIATEQWDTLVAAEV